MDITSLKKTCLIIACAYLLSWGLFAYETEDCISCHSGSEGGTPRISGSEYESSVHGSMMTCTDCHSYIEEGHEDGSGKGSADCSQCHDVINYHGEPSERDNKPECYSCHTKHNILSAEEENSSVNDAQLENTCSGCHPDKWNDHGYFRRFTAFRLSSHKKQDFSKDYSKTNCTGCHQGMAVHGETEAVNREDKCYKCHMLNNQSALMERFHSGDGSGPFNLWFSIAVQMLMLAAAGFVIRILIIKPALKPGKREE